MSKLILVHYRSGSTLLQALMGVPWRIESARGNVEEANKLSEKWKGVLPWLNISRVRNDVPELCFRQISHPNEVRYGKNEVQLSYVGDWWGDAQCWEIPKPYGDSSPASWSYEVLNSAKLKEHRVAGLIRDGRNYVASMLKIAKHTESSGSEYNEFLKRTLGWRNRARIFIDAKELAPHFEIFKFEDLVRQPTYTTGCIFSHLHCTINPDKVRENLKATEGGKKHSPFSDNRHNDRWHSWNDYWKEEFISIAGAELKELGYDTDI